MKINLTTTTITPPAESLLTFEQLKEAESGVYLCHTHQHENPSQRIIKGPHGLVLCNHDHRTTIEPVGGGQEQVDCRFILAPEQVVNITFEKEAPPKCPGTIAPLDQHEIEKGDKVRVLRLPTRGERGWTDYVKQLEGTVGGVFEVAHIYNVGHGYKKSAVLEGCGFSLPFFVLEKVS